MGNESTRLGGGGRVITSKMSFFVKKFAYWLSDVLIAILGLVFTGAIGAKREVNKATKHCIRNKLSY